MREFGGRLIFTSVNKRLLQEAFGISQRESENAGNTDAARHLFRSIACLIWRAHGESGAPPRGSGEAIGQQLIEDARGAA